MLFTIILDNAPPNTFRIVNVVMPLASDISKVLVSGSGILPETGN